MSTSYKWNPGSAYYQACIFGQTRIVRFLVVECNCDTSGFWSFIGSEGPVHAPEVTRLIKQNSFWHDSTELCEETWYQEPVRMLDSGWHSGDEARSWDPKCPDIHCMSGVDFALFHGNVHTFDTLVALRKMAPVTPGARFEPLVANEWLDNNELVAEARAWCLSRSHMHVRNCYNERYTCQDDESTDTDDEWITNLLASEFSKKMGCSKAEALRHEYQRAEEEELNPTRPDPLDEFPWGDW